jgi:hypothetical protein
MKKLKRRNSKLKRKHIRKKLILAFVKGMKNKGEGIAKMNGII